MGINFEFGVGYGVVYRNDDYDERDDVTTKMFKAGYACTAVGDLLDGTNEAEFFSLKQNVLFGDVMRGDQALFGAYNIDKLVREHGFNTDVSIRPVLLDIVGSDEGMSEETMFFLGAVG